MHSKNTLARLCGFFGLALLITATAADNAMGQTNVIGSTGNVGIGTTSPNHNLQVVGSTLFDSMTSDFMEMSSTNGPYIRFQKAGVVQGYFGFANPIGMTGSPGATAQGWFSNGNVFIEAAGGNIRLTGNVGIGTTSPGAKLEVVGAGQSATNVLWLANDASPSNPFITMHTGNTGTDYFATSNTNSTDYLTAIGTKGGNKSLITAGTTILASITGNVGIGTTSPGQKLDVLGGNINVSSSGGVGGNITISGTINAKYQDVAEWVPSSEQLSAGTVVVLDSTKSNQVTSSSVSYDTRVAGVISEQPGIALGEKSDGKVLVATTGRVRVKVDASKGPIHIGDLLVTSDVPGVAMKSEPVEFAGRKMHMPGTLIGKALEPLAKGKGEILVLLSLQ